MASIPYLIGIARPLAVSAERVLAHVAAARRTSGPGPGGLS